MFRRRRNREITAWNGFNEQGRGLVAEKKRSDPPDQEFHLLEVYKRILQRDKKFLRTLFPQRKNASFSRKLNRNETGFLYGEKGIALHLSRGGSILQKECTVNVELIYGD